MIQRLFSELSLQSLPIYVVGGCLRQKLLALPIDDYDLILPRGAIALAEKLAHKFDLNWIILDRERDMARLFCAGVTLDFAAYGDCLEVDLGQRDLSINAMACPVEADFLSVDIPALKAKLIDPYQGFQDLQNSFIRGISKHNFEADPLRILRVFRFAATLGFKIEQETWGWTKDLAPRLAKIASERILTEVFKLLQAPKTVSTLQNMVKNHLLTLLFGERTPEQSDLILYEIELLEQSLMAQDWREEIERYLKQYAADRRNYVFLLKLALLGNTDLQRLGLTAFKHLSLSRQETEVLQLWWQEAQTVTTFFAKTPDPRTCFHLYRRCQEHILGLAILGQVWLRSGRWQGEATILERLSEGWLEPQNPMAHPAALVNGKDVLNLTGLRPGPRIGEILLSVQEAQACGEIQTRQDALTYLQNLGSDDAQ